MRFEPIFRDLHFLSPPLDAIDPRIVNENMKVTESFFKLDHEITNLPCASKVKLHHNLNMKIKSEIKDLY